MRWLSVVREWEFIVWNYCSERERELCGMDLDVKFTIKRHFLKINIWCLCCENSVQLNNSFLIFFS